MRAKQSSQYTPYVNLGARIKRPIFFDTSNYLGEVICEERSYIYCIVMSFKFWRGIAEIVWWWVFFCKVDFIPSFLAPGGYSHQAKWRIEGLVSGLDQ